jgi:hypothetical protein
LDPLLCAIQTFKQVPQWPIRARPFRSVAQTRAAQAPVDWGCVLNDAEANAPFRD